MPSKYRLADKDIIKKCASTGIKKYGKFFTVKYMHSEEKKYAIIVSKKYDKKATERNKIKRKIRTILVKNIDLFPSGFTLIMMKNSSGETSKMYNELEKDLTTCLINI